MEDEANIRELVVYTLETTGFEARGFEEGTSFFEALAEELPELILLDIMLPGEDGMEILKKLKTSGRTKDIPVIMVTAKGAEYDKVMGLDAGADDYVDQTIWNDGTGIQNPCSTQTDIKKRRGVIPMCWVRSAWTVKSMK